ncbi:hypothetical protein GOP47_0007031 [Adiantum capillus-veneris]|uniref:BZIP domain-containing protein n=1 Tax=Adiantum capillus-veneris TaxID=13818 RepID=A0A9D4V0R2_ADICA|nr:hypothetical protein GOP47_0007031 [Adiantum capillus-veneris]
MAKLLEGDSRGFQRGPNGFASRLPPRIPSIPGRALLSSDLGPGIHSGQSFEDLGKGQRQHKRTPSCNMVMQEQPVWLDDLLEDSEGSSKKSSHRRSASDSFTFLENAGSLCTFNNIAEEEFSYTGSFPTEKSKSGNIINSNCLTDLLDEIRQLQDQRNAPISAVPQPAVLRSEVSRLDDTRALSTKSGSTLASNLKGFSAQSVSLPEGKSLEASEAGCHDNTAVDVNSESKKAKRQSAQRSRVRKLQYIAELERIVNALQTQVSSLSPQVLLFQHQRTLLNMDNAALKQEIALCMREKSIKDSQNETLSTEVQRLQRLYELQLLHDTQRQKQQPHRIHRHSSLPTDFGVQLHQYKELTAHPTHSDLAMASPDILPRTSPDMLPRVMEELASMSLDAQGERAPQRGS